MTALVLHIGMPKAGSSTIQSFLARHAERLGIGFRFDAEHLLVSAANDETEAIDIRPVVEPLRRFPFSVLSDEKLASQVRKPRSARALGDLLGPHFQSVRLFCYVRRQDESVVSAYSTTLLSGRTKRFLGPGEHWGWHAHQRLTIWRRALGAENMIVRRFGATYFTGGGLIEDCAAALGLSLEGLRRTTAANVSPTAEAMELMRLLNVELAEHPARRAIVKMVMQAPLPGRRLGMSRSDRLAFMQAFAESNAALAQEFFGEAELFHHDFPDDAIEDVRLSAADILSMARTCGCAGLPDEAASEEAAIRAVAAAFLAMSQFAHPQAASTPPPA